MKDEKILIIDSRPYGLFSIFLHTIDNIKWAEDNGYIPVVRWGPGRTDVNLNRHGAKKASDLGDPSHVGDEPNFSTKAEETEKEACLYSDKRQLENEKYSCWNHFFEPVSKYSVEDAINSKNFEESDIFQVGFHDLNLSSLSDKFLIYNLHSYTPLNVWLYYYRGLTGADLHRNKVHSYIKKYVKVKSSIKKKVESFAKENFTENMIGVHIRGTDKSSESNIGQRPHIFIEDYVNNITEALKINPKSSLFVASDNNEAIRSIFESFPDNKILVYKCTRMPSYSSITPVHLSSAAGPILGEEALIDCLLLAKCNHLVCTDSNLAAAAMYFNPQSEVSFVNLKGK